MCSLPSRLDHLIYVVPDLEAALPAVEASLGVRPVLGGCHPEWGTWNAILSLGSDVYLELVARDPIHSAAVGSPVVDFGEEVLPPGGLFGVDRIRTPRLATWCVRVEGLADRSAAASRVGWNVGSFLEGSRERPDGTRVSWRISDPTGDREGGVVPFLIAWGKTTHPSRGIPGGIADSLTLQALSVEHPDPERIRRWLDVLELDVSVAEAPAPALVAVLNTPLGEVMHRSDAQVFPRSRTFDGS